MPTPVDIARVVYKKREQQRLDEYEEVSANNHFAFDSCDHHCYSCCPWPHLAEKTDT